MRYTFHILIVHPLLAKWTASVDGWCSFK